MDVTVYNKDLEILAVIDSYYSLIWNTKHAEKGDFEWILSVSYAGSEPLVPGNYITIESEPGAMIIQDISPSYTEEEQTVTVEGYSVEDILESRVVPEVTYESGLVQDYVESIVSDNIISPVNPKRALTAFSSVVITPSSPIFLDNKYGGGTVYSVIKQVCDDTGLGFRVHFNKATRTFEFSLVEGVLRDGTDVLVPKMEFSYDHDNVLSHKYQTVTSDHKTVAVVVTEDPTVPLREVWGGDEPEGYDRREVYLDNTNVSREVDGGTLTDTQYEYVLDKNGSRLLYSLRPMGILDGEVLLPNNVVPHEDLKVGDYVVCVFEEGPTTAMVVEIVRSINEEGIKVMLSFDYNV